MFFVGDAKRERTPSSKQHPASLPKEMGEEEAETESHHTLEEQSEHGDLDNDLIDEPSQLSEVKKMTSCLFFMTINRCG